VKAVALKEFNYTYPEAAVNTFVASFYEAVMLYAYALNDTLEQGYEISNGSAVTHAMWNRTFPGITGNVSIDGNGDRQADYSLLDMDPETGNFEVVANYYGDTQQLTMKENRSITWSGGRTSPPPDKPVCGFDGSLCPDTAFPKYAIVSIVLSGVMVIMLITSLFMYR
ncbi:atrial natriuretic peptide receptor 1-like, partial [Amphibalanus amphitrite]|uniref:atrial natriuretic peptide receptor 1-like n=1 Tax=Amphibalanus amphitrite TaxID=1232801 RepID=UPI001C919C4F